MLVDARSAKVISRPSLATLQADEEGRRFPWRPRALKELLQTVELVDSAGKLVHYSSVQNGYKALYFSAHWVSNIRILVKVR